MEEPACYQLVGEVMLTKAMTARGRESATPHKVTETRGLHLRVAATENIAQWAKA